MKTNSRKVLVAFLAFAGLVSYAQKPQPPDPAQMVQHRVNFLTNKLGLSAEQQQQATSIFTNALTAQKSLHDQLRTAHTGLQTAVTKNDAAGIDQAANTIGNLTAQSISAHAKAEAAFFQTLNSQQQSTYTQMQSHGPGRHGFHGHGGPGGFGGPGGPGGPPPF